MSDNLSSSTTQAAVQEQPWTTASPDAALRSEHLTLWTGVLPFERVKDMLSDKPLRRPNYRYAPTA